jgi:hypothetical protein
MTIIDIIGDDEDIIVTTNDTKKPHEQRCYQFREFPQLQLIVLDHVEDTTNHALFQHSILEP